MCGAYKTKRRATPCLPLTSRVASFRAKEMGAFPNGSQKDPPPKGFVGCQLAKNRHYTH